MTSALSKTAEDYSHHEGRKEGGVREEDWTDRAGPTDRQFSLLGRPGG